MNTDSDFVFLLYDIVSVLESVGFKGLYYFSGWEGDFSK